MVSMSYYPLRNKMPCISNTFGSKITQPVVASLGQEKVFYVIVSPNDSDYDVTLINKIQLILEFFKT